MHLESPLPPAISSAIDELPKSLRGDAELIWRQIIDPGALSLPDDRVKETTKVWAASPFIGSLCARQPELWRSLIESADFARRYNPGELAERIETAVAKVDSESVLMKILRRLRLREAVRIGWRDLTGAAPLNETMRDLTNLAEACVRHALDWCYRDLCRRFGVPRNASGDEQCLIVLAMGKLGGRELNFSSDVDLIFAYPEEGVTDGAKSLENSQFFIRLGQRLIKVLNDTTAEGFVFRVDMRLRPFGEAGPLAMSANAMEDYFQQHGREWERYALIKARVIAGDHEAGRQLLKRLRPFIYRRYLDYGAFEALRKMKGLINDEIKRRGMGDNIKLGAGGIREIEFIGQAFQLIRGGRDISLQERSIQKVLGLLANKHQLPSFAVTRLLEAYTFLRHTENRLQMMGDQQTHLIPTDNVQRDRLALAMGYGDWPAFKLQLDLHRRHVDDQFEGVFATPQYEQAVPHSDGRERTGLQQLWQGVMDDEQAVQLLARNGYRNAADVYAALKKHRQGRAYRLKSEMGRTRMDRLMPLLIAAVGQSTHPDTLLPRLLALTEAIARRSVYIALLAENPLALSQLVKLSAASPWIAEYLTRHPILLDELLDPRRLYAPQDKPGLEVQLKQELTHVDNQDMETLMDRLRHFKQASVLKVAAADVMGALPLMKVSDQLTWIAEVILDKVLTVAWQQLLAKYGRPRCLIAGKVHFPGLAIVAYGKLGGIELGYGSDLDMVFLHDSAGEKQYTEGGKIIDNAVFFARLGARIIHLLTTFTPAGELYEVDARLRPSGRAGMLVNRVTAFEQYQRARAWTWEHQALVRARVVAGDPRIARQFAHIRRAVLGQPRNKRELCREVRAMRQKMWEEFAADTTHRFDLKRDPGGITDIEFMVQYSVLANAHEYPSLCDYTDNIRILDSLERCRLLSAENAAILRDSYRVMRDAVHAMSLQGEPAIVDETQYRARRREVMRIWRVLMHE
jgi:glutamate-ammonia-ligase adenylyltransferase